MLWSWLVRRIYRQFVYGLSRIGNLQVFTSSGAGTWGRLLRLGSHPEIVALQSESGPTQMRKVFAYSALMLIAKMGEMLLRR